MPSCDDRLIFGDGTGAALAFAPVLETVRWVRLSLITIAKLNDIDLQAWPADVLTRIADIPQNQLADLLPWNWQALENQRQAA